MKRRNSWFGFCFIISIILLNLCAGANGEKAKWYRGNLHTHTYWSDGDDFPEMAIEWYKTNGYQFLALSDHNILSVGQKWLDVEDKRLGADRLKRYIDRFGEEWVELRIVDGKEQVRLQPLNEARALYEEPDKFLLIQAQEITDVKGVHLNGINLVEKIEVSKKPTPAEIIQADIDAVIAQQEKTGQKMLVHINHPNCWYAVTAEDIMGVKGVKFFEVSNGHPSVANHGDDEHPDVERMWDIILTKRLAELNLSILYGVATDDTHNYHLISKHRASPGRAWVMVRSMFLTPESIIEAMDAGDFYSTTGVTIEDFGFDGETLKIEIAAEDGVTYKTQFIGTLKGYDPESEPVVDAEGKEKHITRTYSDDIGKVLAEVEGVSASYALTGEEIYVRAKVISSKTNVNSLTDDYESAWIQPVVQPAK